MNYRSHPSNTQKLMSSPKPRVCNLQSPYRTKSRKLLMCEECSRNFCGIRQLSTCLIMPDTTTLSILSFLNQKI